MDENVFWLSKKRIRTSNNPFSASYKFVLFMLLAHTCLYAPSCQAAPANYCESDLSPTVYYAGFAYLGRHELIEKNYPHAIRINDADNKIYKLQKHFVDLIKNDQPKHFNFSFELADRRKQSDSIVFAFAVDKEYISIEKFKKSKKLIAEVSAQLLFFNYGTMALIANIPVDYSKNHLISTSDDLNGEIRSLFDDIYLGLNGSEGLFSRAVSELQRIDINESVNAIRYQVSQVDMKTDLENYLPRNISSKCYKQYLGQTFSKELSNQYRVSVLPYVKGYTFGNKMPGRFANGDVFTIILPEPDYTFEFNVRNFAKLPDKKTFLYGAAANFKFSEPLQKKNYIDGDYLYAVPKKCLDQDGLDDWGAYDDAVEELIKELVAQLGQPEKHWFKVHARDPGTYKQFKTQNEMFRRAKRND